MKFEASIQGDAEFEKLLRELKQEAFPVMVQSGFQSFERIMTIAKDEYVPVDKGPLKSSGHVATPNVSGQTAEITMGFGGPSAPYALAVHENPRAGKTGGISPKGKAYESWARAGEWKYLETPLKAGLPGIEAHMKADLVAYHARKAR